MIKGTSRVVAMLVAMASVPVQQSPPPGLSGSYAIHVNGKPAGVERFSTEAREGGVVVRASSETTIDGKTIRLESSTEFEDGALAQYFLELEDGEELWKYDIVFEGLEARVGVVNRGRRTERTADLGYGSTMLDRNVWIHYLLLLRQYDSSTGGKQYFRAFLPQARFGELRAEVELRGDGVVEVGREKKAGKRFRIVLGEGFQVNVLADDSGLPLLIEVPSEKLRAVLAEINR